MMGYLQTATKRMEVDITISQNVSETWKIQERIILEREKDKQISNFMFSGLFCDMDRPFCLKIVQQIEEQLLFTCKTP